MQCYTNVTNFVSHDFWNFKNCIHIKKKYAVVFCLLLVYFILWFICWSSEQNKDSSLSITSMGQWWGNGVIVFEQRAQFCNDVLHIARFWWRDSMVVSSSLKKPADGRWQFARHCRPDPCCLRTGAVNMQNETTLFQIWCFQTVECGEISLGRCKISACYIQLPTRIAGSNRYRKPQAGQTFVQVVESACQLLYMLVFHSELRPMMAACTTPVAEIASRRTK